MENGAILSCARAAPRCSRGPMPWPSLPNGGNFAARTSMPSRPRCARPRYSTGEISTTRAAWRAPASVIMQSVVVNVLWRANHDPIDSGDFVRRRRHQALAAVAGDVSQAIVGADRQADHAAGYGDA